MAHWDPSDDAEAECGGKPGPGPTPGWKLALEAENRRLTAEINAILERCAQDVRWADARRKCGDLHRYQTGLRGAWLQAERSFARLGEPANDTRRRPPELYIIAGEHPAFGSCATCEGTGRLVNGDGRACQLCAGTGSINPGDYEPANARPLLTADSEEPTAIEKPTSAELPVLGGQEVA